jgi:hypothetical protein
MDDERIFYHPCMCKVGAFAKNSLADFSLTFYADGVHE